MMFKGAYTSEFYRALHDAIHSEVESWTSRPRRFALRLPANRRWLRFAAAWTNSGTVCQSLEEPQECRCNGDRPMDLLLTHGYFLYEDPKELQIMKPYVPLGILYLTSHLRARNFEVEVFDSTFPSRRIDAFARSEKPAVLGVYANLMTRSSALQILKAARSRVEDRGGGPEPGLCRAVSGIGSGCGRHRRRRDHTWKSCCPS